MRTLLLSFSKYLSTIFLIINKHFIYSARVDEYISLSGGSTRTGGTWKSPVYCPDNTFAKEFSHITDIDTDTTVGYQYDDTGTQSLILYCYDLDGNYVSSIASNNHFAGVQSEKLKCPADNNIYLQGINLKVGPNHVAIVSIGMACSNADELYTTLEYTAPSLTASWKGVQYCNEGTAVCGAEALFMDFTDKAADDSALNDINIICCTICDKRAGLYLDSTTITCKFCHYSCKECSGALSSSCTACFHSDTLSSGTCSTISSKKFKNKKYFIFFSRLSLRTLSPIFF